MIIDGKKIAEEMLADAAAEVKKLPKPPRLAAVSVGDIGDAKKFLELKKKAAEKVGVEYRIYEFPADVTTQKLRKEVVKITKAGVNDGVLIELPLPSHINPQYILNAIPPEKDVDVLSERAQGAFFARLAKASGGVRAGRSPVLPPAVEAVRQILQKYDIDPKGKSCAVFGYGLLVGRQVSHWLASRGATVSIINEFALDPKSYTLNADLIVSGVGKPNLITADMVKEGVVVIDFGKDVDFESVSKKAGLITPPVGGVGPIVISSVLKNLVILMKLIKK